MEHVENADLMVKRSDEIKQSRKLYLSLTNQNVQFFLEIMDAVVKRGHLDA